MDETAGLGAMGGIGFNIYCFYNRYYVFIGFPASRKDVIKSP